MAIVPPPQPDRPTLSWTIVVDVQPGFPCVAEAAQLVYLPAGTSVVLDVAASPHEVDTRVAEFIRSAWRSRALHLELRGPVGPVSAWWRELTATPQPQAPRRLELIRGGADT